MSALSTPGGGGTTTQNKPTSGKQKYQKLDINSLYCVNRNENSEPSSVKSQLSRKHGMQSLGKVPSARRPPANLPSLKTEIGQDTNSTSVSVTITTTTATPASCTQTTATTSNSSGIVAGTAPGGWVALPPPSSPHFRTEFPSLEAAAQPSHRASDHSALQPQLRPQTEGSWTSGGTAGVRPDATCSPAAAPATAPASAPVSQQTPAFRAILPSFLMKGSSGSSGLGLGTLGSLRDSRSSSGSAGGPRSGQRQPAAPRAVEVLTARPILRDEQISSLDDMSLDAGWAQHDDIDYDQKLDFSDGESSTPAPNKTNIKNRTGVENERLETKIQEPGDEDQLWAERRQKQSNEVAQAVARARQRKEEEQRRQMREAAPLPTKDIRERLEKSDRDRSDNRDREPDFKEKDKHENRDRERLDNREKERGDVREMREKERADNRDNRDRYDNRDRNRDRDRDRIGDVRERDRERTNNDNRDGEKDRASDVRDRERGDNRDRIERDRFERDRERDRPERERNDRDFRDRDYGRDREQSNPAFSKTFQANIPPRFLKQQQNRQQDDQHKPWMFSGKQAPPRRQDAPPYNAPRHTSHNGRRSYSRDYSDREDDFRREKDGNGQQWRSEMQEYDRNSRETDRVNSKDSYKEYGDYKDKKHEPDRKSLDLAEQSRTSAADKLTEVFERKSIGLVEPFAICDPNSQSQERRVTPPSNISQRESLERDFSKTSWAEITQEEQNNFSSSIPPLEKTAEIEITNDTQAYVEKDETIHNLSPPLQITPLQIANSTPPSTVSSFATESLNSMAIYHNNMAVPNFTQIEQSSQSISRITTLPSAVQNLSINDNVTLNTNVPSQFIHKPVNSNDNFSNAPQIQKQASLEQLVQSGGKMFNNQKAEKDFSETESVASKSSTDPSRSSGNKMNESNLIESVPVSIDSQKRPAEDKRNEKFGNEQFNKIPNKEPVERKSSGSGSEKRGRGYGSGSGGYAVYNRGWGARESRGRRSHRSSRSNRGSESDGSTDGTLNAERKDRRRAPRSPRGPKKPEKYDNTTRSQIDHLPSMIDGMENREPFAPRGQPSRRGRGGFQGASRPPAPAKRVTGYGPPNTKSPFSQANRAVKESEEAKENIQLDDKGKLKSRIGSSGRGRDRRPKGVGGPFSGEDENWETTSEHSEGGSAVGRHRSAGGRQGSTQKNQSGRGQNSNNRQNNNRNNQVGKKDGITENKSNEITDTTTDLKLLPSKKEEDIVDDGFQEVRNKKNSKEVRGSALKEDNQHISKQSRSHSNHSGGRNGSSSRNPNDKSNIRGSAPVAGKSGSQYDRPRQSNLPPRFAKQRQKQQMGLVTAFGPDTGAAPPPPPVNAWDKPISQTLRANVEESIEISDIKSNQSSQRSTPGDAPEVKVSVPCAITTDKTGVLDGTTPPVETIIFENTNFKTAPPAEALKQKYQPNQNTAKPQNEEIPTELEARPMNFNGDVRAPPRSIQELIADNSRPVVTDSEGGLGLQMSFDTAQKAEDSSDMKLDFAFDSDLGQLTEDKSAKSLGLPRGTHMSTSNTISPLAADLNLKIASVKKVWEMPAVAEGSEDLQFAGFEEANTETGAPPNVCKVKPTQQLQSPPPQHFNHVGYQGGYGGLSVPSPPAVLFNSSQQLLGSSQQMQQQGGLYGAFLDQSRGQFGGFPASPYGAGSGAPYNYQPPPDMFQSLPSQYRMAAASGGGAAFGQSGQLGNSPNTVLISSSSNSLMSATVKPSSQQIGAIGSKGGGVGGVGSVGVGGVNTYQQQYLGFSGPVGESPYSLPGLLPRPAPPANSYYSPYQPPAAPAPTYPLQFTQPAQNNAFSTQFLSSQLQVAAAVHQMQQQYRAPLQQQYTPPQPRPPPQQPLKSPLHEHANGFAPLCEAGSPTPKGAPKPKPAHSPPQHKYHAPPPHAAHMAHPPPAHTPHQHQHQHQHHQHQHQHHQQQMMVSGNNGRCGGGGGGGGGARGTVSAPRYPAPIQRPHAPAPPLYRAPPPPRHAPHQPHQQHQTHQSHQRPNLYYHHQQRNGGSTGGGGGGGGAESGDGAGGGAGSEGESGGAEVPLAPPAEGKAE